MTTMTRRSSVLVSVLISLASTANAARPAVGSPFGNDTCVFPTEVTQNMEDPNAWFSAAPNCHALCRKVEGQCKQLVRSSFTCQMQWLAITVGYDKKQCEVTYEGNAALIKSCKKEMDAVQKSARLDISDGRDEALGACEDWDATCEATCVPP